MLRALLLVIGLGSASVFLAQLLKQKGPGYVLLYYNHYSVETSVWLFVGLVVAVLFSLFVLYKLLGMIIRGLCSAGFIAQKRQKKKQMEKTQAGLLAYQSQHWQAAGKHLLASAKGNDCPFISYMLSAKAFLQLHDFDQAKAALKKAAECSDIDEISLLLTEVDLAYATKDNGKANQTMQKALNQYPKDPRVLLKAYEIYQHTSDHSLLEKIVTPLKKQGLLSGDCLNYLQQCHIVSQLECALKERALKDFDKVWKQAKPFHNDPVCYMSYFRGLETFGEIPSLMKKVEKQLDSQWREELVQFYVGLSHDKQHQYDYLQRLLKKQGDNPILQLCMGKLAFALDKQEEAISHLQNTLVMKPTPEANFLLAKIYADKQQVTESLSCLEQVF